MHKKESQKVITISASRQNEGGRGKPENGPVSKGTVRVSQDGTDAIIEAPNGYTVTFHSITKRLELIRERMSQKSDAIEI